MRVALGTSADRTDPGEADASPIIDVAHLSKSYGDQIAVRDVSFSVNRAEILGILGPNGAGKTTTVEILQGLRTADGGTIRVLGLDPARSSDELRRRIGSQLQESALPERIRVWEALDLFASVGPGRVDWRPLLEQWGLAEKGRASFASLSGGQRQRLFVALALLHQPEIVFLDELTQGLDPAARRVAWQLIKAIRDQGTTVVLVTHYMDEAEQLCDRVAVVDRGTVIAEGSPAELRARFGRRVTVSFATDRDVSWLKAVPGVERVIRRGARVEVDGSGSAPALVAAELVGRGIVPEDLQIDRPTLEEVFLQITGPEGRSDR